MQFSLMTNDELIELVETRLYTLTNETLVVLCRELSFRLSRIRKERRNGQA